MLEIWEFAVACRHFVFLYSRTYLTRSGQLLIPNWSGNLGSASNCCAWSATRILSPPRTLSLLFSARLAPVQLCVCDLPFKVVIYWLPLILDEKFVTGQQFLGRLQCLSNFQTFLQPSSQPLTFTCPLAEIWATIEDVSIEVTPNLASGQTEIDVPPPADPNWRRPLELDALSLSLLWTTLTIAARSNSLTFKLSFTFAHFRPQIDYLSGECNFDGRPRADAL